MLVAGRSRKRRAWGTGRRMRTAPGIVTAGLQPAALRSTPERRRSWGSAATGASRFSLRRAASTAAGSRRGLVVGGPRRAGQPGASRARSGRAAEAGSPSKRSHSAGSSGRSPGFTSALTLRWASVGTGRTAGVGDGRGLEGGIGAGPLGLRLGRGGRRAGPEALEGEAVAGSGAARVFAAGARAGSAEGRGSTSTSVEGRRGRAGAAPREEAGVLLVEEGLPAARIAGFGGVAAAGDGALGRRRWVGAFGFAPRVGSADGDEAFAHCATG